MSWTAFWVAASSTTTPTTSDVDPTTGHGQEWGKAAPIGLLVIVLLIVAGYFLARSFSKQMRRVPASFDPPGPSDPEQVEVEAVTPGPAPLPPRPKAGRRPDSGGSRSG